MNNKFLLRLALSAFGITCTTATFAQDKIYFHDGRVIDAKVMQLNNKEITYKRYDNLEGADYVVPRRDVDKLVYENGVSETLRGKANRTEAENNDDADEHIERHKSVADAGYGMNILSVVPIQMTDESTVGVGLQYERVLDKKGVFSFYLPFAVSFFEDNIDVYTPTGYINQAKTGTAFTVFPGVKIYPAGSGRRFAYSVGPSLGYTFGNRYVGTQVYDPNNQNYRMIYEEKSFYKFGFLINNGLNIQPTKHLYVGIELGLGIIYASNKSSDYTAGNDPIAQFNFKMGYRF